MAAWEPTMTFITDNRISSVEAPSSRVCLKPSGGWRPACRGGRHLAVRKRCTKSSIASLSEAIPPGSLPGSTAGGTRAIVATRRLVPVRRQDSAAFTLLELILAMTILVIMLALSAPTLANFFHGRALDSEARRLLSLTRSGQSRAVSEGVPMELWVDAEKRNYGLEAEDSYTKTDANNGDAKAVQFDLDRDVKIEVPNLSAARPAAVVRSSSTPISTASVLPVAAKHPGLPMIRFLPDGSVSDTSPRMLHLTDRDGASLWLALARTRLNYEIQKTQPQ